MSNVLAIIEKNDFLCLVLKVLWCVHACVHVLQLKKMTFDKIVH